MIMGIDWDRHLLGPLQGVFGEPVTYRPTVGTAYDITGIFDRAYTQDVDPLDGGSSINTTSPTLGVRDAVFISPPQKGDRLYIPRVDCVFVVRDIHPDSHGGSRLLLNRVSS